MHYYERTGTLLATRRTAADYRQHDVEASRRSQFIKEAQALGFLLVDANVRALTCPRQNLKGLVAPCEAREATAECPVLETLGTLETMDAVIDR